jgi:hypothetical protein
MFTEVDLLVRLHGAARLRQVAKSVKRTNSNSSYVR